MRVSGEVRVESQALGEGIAGALLSIAICVVAMFTI